jgi:hypothetical protein
LIINFKSIILISMSGLGMKQGKNPLLAKDDVGKARGTVAKLPPNGFTYGKADQRDNEGAKEGK